jgi:hypothetical protein
LLLPFSIVTDMLFADGWGALALALPAPLVLLVLHHEIVVRSKAHLEEQALEHAQRETTKNSPTRRLRRMSSRSRRRRPFPLAPVGRPETAILWKNLMQSWRPSLAGSAGVAVALLVVVAVLPGLMGWHEVVYGVLAMGGAITALIFAFTSGMNWQNDLRSEISRLEYARTWPVSAERLVLAEVLSPALLSFLFATFGLGLSFAGIAGSHFRAALAPVASGAGTPFGQSQFLGTSLLPAAILLGVGLLPPLAAVCVTSSAIQNLAVLWLPAWVPKGSARQRGIAALGQRLVFASALALMMAVLVLPSAALVGIAVWVQWLAGWPWSAWAFPLWGLLAASPAFVASWLIVKVAGRFWETLDASSEILESGA